MHGKVKNFNGQKGYGFITGQDTLDYFVHCSDIIGTEQDKTFQVGESVIFEPQTIDGKLRAVMVLRECRKQAMKVYNKYKGFAPEESIDLIYDDESFPIIARDMAIRMLVHPARG